MTATWFGMAEDDFGLAYVIKAMAEDVKRIAEQLPSFATRTEMAFVSARLDEYVPRRELAMTQDGLSRQITDLKEEVREMRSCMATKDDVTALQAGQKEGPIRAWVWPMVSACVAVVALIVALVRTGAVPSH